MLCDTSTEKEGFEPFPQITNNEKKGVSEVSSLLGIQKSIQSLWSVSDGEHISIIKYATTLIRQWRKIIIDLAIMNSNAYHSQIPAVAIIVFTLFFLSKTKISVYIFPFFSYVY